MLNSQKSQDSDNKNNQLINFATWEWLVIWGLIGLIIFGPIIFTQFDSGPSFIGSGEIGDTIGGITAPFVNLLAAFLVYKSFTAQIATNKQQREDHNEQMSHLNREQKFSYISNLFKLIKDNYYQNNKYGQFDCSHIEFIFTKSHDFRLTEQFIELQKLENQPNPTQQQIKRIEELVKEIKEIKQGLEFSILEPIRLTLGTVKNIFYLIEELENSELQIGIKTFYRNEIHYILADMDLWIFTTDEFELVKEIKSFKLLKLKESNESIVEIEEYARKIIELGYPLLTNPTRFT